MPLIAVALHDGHEVSPATLRHMEIDDDAKRREEDAHTAALTEVADTRVIVRRSRFEVDLNRPRDRAVYGGPDDTWGLKVWKDGCPSEEVKRRSLEEYDAFHREIEDLFNEWRDRFGQFVVLDLHSYNHHREEPRSEPDDPAKNPDVNVGTEWVDCDLWGPLVERFVRDLGAFDFMGRRLDVREDVKFTGGNFAHWMHDRFGNDVAILAVEFKKIYVDERTNELDTEALNELKRGLASTIPGIVEEWEKIRERACQS